VTAGVGHHSYIVGGAPRDFTLGRGFKDVDVVVERMGQADASTLGTEIADRIGITCASDAYGVVHIGPIPHSYIFRGTDLIGQKIEIVTARKEKYDRSKKDSHKPCEVAPGTILEDVLRRDFTINTLMWKLADLTNGPEGAPVIDLLGSGLKDLRARRLKTPLDPNETFADDPSRILRAFRFAAKYSMSFDSAMSDAIAEMIPELQRLPYEVVADILIDKILALPAKQAQAALMIMAPYGELFNIVSSMVPSGRFRRGLNGKVRDARTLILFMQFFGPENCDTKINVEDLDALIRHAARSSDEELNRLYGHYLKPPLNTPALMDALGLQGAQIGEAVKRARAIVLKEPSITAAKLQEQITNEYKNKEH
jgi:tRNA nucleotidyltransferase/poly(A) polymerase